MRSRVDAGTRVCYSDEKAEWRVPMAIPKELLDILVCPVCKAPVKLLADGSALKCPTCRRLYPVRDEIPVMLPEEATIAPE